MVVLISGTGRKCGATGGYSIKNNKLDVGSGGIIYWSANLFGPSQEAYLKLATVDGNAEEQDLLLKAQCNTGYSCGVLEVMYDAPNQRVQVITYESSQGWVQRGADISVSFANGDILGARATANGQVSVYKNGVLQATRDISSWPYYDDGGYIGVWYVSAGSAYGDDFGGGSMPGASLLGVHVKASLVKAAHEKAYHKAQMMQIPPAGQVWKSYYFAGSVRIAMRVQVNGVADQVYYLLADHLGSTAITVDVNNNKQAELRYAPWGTTRYVWGETPTDYRYTGQREEEGIGLYYYQSRFFDPNLGRFIQADTIVPNVFFSQAFDRYTYIYNNPVKYIDPSGHKPCQWGDHDPKCNTYSDIDYHLDQQIEKPDAVCRRNEQCYQSYLTYKELVWTLHFVPSPEQILYMTAQAEGYSNKNAEYHGSGTFEGNFIGGLARNYYQPYINCQIGSPYCTQNKLYWFMSGYEVWFGTSTHLGERVSNLINKGLNNNKFRPSLEQTTRNITNPDIVQSNGWSYGIGDPNNDPWQWHNWTRPPEEGEALGWIFLRTNNGDYFWIMTYNQNLHFKKDIEK